MNSFMQAARDFARDEEGITAIEYGLIAAAMAGVIAVAFTPLRAAIVAAFGEIITAMNVV
ncbi:Flp family type IVb pilin [Pseudoduganella aquatica]|jgi:pilus assembly protein Flp/PilA|uniref:Flp family type IVb pilin n=1 Tax=Pseudoduganella aquatica TaxID=2660641 RepID=A0A7X4HG98_9BURK|nr:Flp family type IVb pilin [Pseudoduganella aquatica]MYN10716.1 Flp family type IVb pilin [Pseudoduganella aquatica]